MHLYTDGILYNKMLIELCVNARRMFRRMLMESILSIRIMGLFPFCLSFEQIGFVFN